MLIELVKYAFLGSSFCFHGSVRVHEKDIKVVAHDHPVMGPNDTLQKPRPGEVFVKAVNPEQSTVNGFYRKTGSRLLTITSEIKHDQPHRQKPDGSSSCD